MKALNTIQKLSKIGKVLSKIAFILAALLRRYGAELTHSDECRKHHAVFVDGMTPHSIWNNGTKTAVVIKISTERAKPDRSEESQ